MAMSAKERKARERERKKNTELEQKSSKIISQKELIAKEKARLRSKRYRDRKRAEFVLYDKTNYQRISKWRQVEGNREKERERDKIRKS